MTKNTLKLALAATLSSVLLTGCGNSENFVFTNTAILPEQPVLQAPVANNDAVVALGNSTLLQAAGNGVLTNDTPNGGTISAFDATSANGATVSLAADGSFTYTPTVGFTGSDTFEYTLTNDVGSSTATVTVSVNGLGFFVDNSQAANGNGSQANPFNNLASAIAAAGSGDTIFVYAGDGTTANQNGTFTLPQGVKLVGQAQGLVAGQTIEPVGDRPQLEAVINPEGNNTIAGLEFVGNSGIFSPAGGADNLVVDNNLFTDLNDQAIGFTDCGGTLSVTNNTFTNNPDRCVSFGWNSNDTATVNVIDNIFTEDVMTDGLEAIRVRAQGSPVVTANVTGNQFTGDSVGTTFNYAIWVEAEDTSDVDINVTGNVATNAAEFGFIFVNVTSSMGVSGTISNNNVDGTNDDGIDYQWGNNVADTFAVRIEGNTVTNTASKPIDLDGATTASSTGIFFVNNNNLSNAGSNVLQFDLGNMANACLALAGNTFNGSNVRLNNSGGTFDVERFDMNDGGPLEDINTFTSSTLSTSGTLTSQAAGYCETQVP